MPKFCVSLTHYVGFYWSFKEPHCMKVKNDHRSEFSNLSNWKEEAWKKSGLQRDSNPWPLRYRCDALPTELWSHILGARSTCWVHIFPWGVKWCKYIWNNSYIWTAVIDESEEWSSQWIFQFKQLERRSLKKIRTALHRYREGHRFESRWSPDFFQASSFQLLKSQCTEILRKVRPRPKFN